MNVLEEAFSEVRPKVRLVASCLRWKGLARRQADRTRRRRVGMGMLKREVRAREAKTVRRVYGDPYRKDGVTIIPAAKVRSGGGARGGYGVTATPVGVYVLRDGEVKWKPAFNLNRAILGAIIVAVVVLLVAPGIVNVLWERGPQEGEEEQEAQSSKGFWRRLFHR
jgi:uncharacterized spore protein YtfJ